MAVFRTQRLNGNGVYADFVPVQADCIVNGAVQAQEAVTTGDVFVPFRVLVSGTAVADPATTTGTTAGVVLVTVSGVALAQDATTSIDVSVFDRPQVLGNVSAQNAVTSGNLHVYTTVEITGAVQAGYAATDGIAGPPVEGPYDLKMKLPNDQWISITDHQNLVNIGTDDHHELYEWKGDWVAGSYNKGYQVEDSGWLMIANKTTEDRPAPQAVGSPFFIYEGTPTTESATAKQIIVGGRYTAQVRAQLLVACRIFLTFEHDYIVYIVRDPTGTPVITEIAAFTAEQGGWQTINLPGGFIQVGESIDVLAIVKEPDDIPVQFTGNWVYSSPQNPAAPDPGEVIHSRSTTSVMSWSKTDADLVDRSADLSTMEVGDTISDGSITWSIQSISDQGTYYDYGVAPAINSTEGLNTYTFETVTASPLSYELDADYWLGNPIAQGLYGADMPYDDIVPDSNQYSVDVEVQDYSTSQDWDVQAKSSSISASAVLSAEQTAWVIASTTGFSIGAAVTTDNGWTEVGRLNIPVGEGHRMRLRGTAKRLDGFGYFYSEAAGIAYNQAGTVAVSYSQVFEEATVNGLGIRISGDGSDVIVEVDGRINQDWEWDIIGFHKQI